MLRLPVEMKKKIVIIFVSLLIVSAVFPWLAYQHYLSFVDGRPSVETQRLSADNLNIFWVENEDYLQKDELNDINPYLFYRVIFYSFLNDNFDISVDDDRLFSATSNMASFIAIWYLRDGHFKGKGMGGWHITNICLTMWIQRHWTPEQLIETYIAYKERLAIRDRKINSRMTRKAKAK